MTHLIVPPAPVMPEMLAAIDPIDPFALEYVFQTPSRNDRCHCGSGDKYKRCHLPIDQEAWRFVMEKSRQADRALARLRATPSVEPLFDPEPE